MAPHTEYSEERVGELIARIQVYIQPRRIRVKEFFKDFDPLRHGRCTQINFARALDMIGMSLTEEEVDVLCQHFTEEGMHVVPPQVVAYTKFSDAVDEVFVEGNPGAHTMSSSPSSTQLMTFQPKSLEEEERFMHCLHRLASLCSARGVVFKYQFTEVDRAAIASPSRTSSYFGGKVTKDQFIRRFPFKKEFAPEDVELIANHYLTERGDVHFMAMHNDISEVTNHEAPPFPTSPLFLKPDPSEWSQSRYSAVDKIRAKVVEKRIRIKEQFQDFDPLRKGLCTASQVKTVFNILNLSKEIDRNDFEQLVGMYTRDDGRFCYAEFVADVDKEFVTPDLERDPLAQTSMPDASSTMPGRRNKVVMSDETIQYWHWLESKIRSKVTKNRINLKPTFQDMDRMSTGHVTKNQFYRCMASLGFDLSEQDVGILGNVYCDLGNHLDFNYVDFLKSVDVPTEDVELAIAQLAGPYQGFEPAQYHDPRGRVMRHTGDSFLG
eukprot:TRINITY_DN4826_c0_g1_i1.p1 TRINITY_DN4826_c0_g1~~TRINITY_DN4826_c0_g1_i1.p1  ORF type:complete len:493 (+),score=105.79 TRINITY_DN4826_c0_g1_i1:99-1577(+)